MCNCTEPHAYKGPTLGLTLYRHHLKLLIIFEQRAPQFQVALGPANYIASPVYERAKDAGLGKANPIGTSKFVVNWSEGARFYTLY